MADLWPILIATSQNKSDYDQSCHSIEKLGQYY